MIGISGVDGRYVFCSHFSPSINAFIMRIYLKLVRITSSFDLKDMEVIIEKIQQRDLSIIVVIWHREILLFSLYKKLTRVELFVAFKHLPDWQERLYKSLGFNMVDMGSPGSIKRAIKHLSSPGSLLIIAVDGPYGPMRIAKPGAALFSSHTGMSIIPAHIDVRSKLFGAMWDERIYPLPFNRLKIVVGSPIHVNSKAKRKDINTATQRYQHALNELISLPLC